MFQGLFDQPFTEHFVPTMPATNVCNSKQIKATQNIHG
jgi:hypothetical protein